MSKLRRENSCCDTHYLQARVAQAVAAIATSLTCWSFFIIWLAVNPHTIWWYVGGIAAALVAAFIVGAIAYVVSAAACEIWAVRTVDKHNQIHLIRIAGFWEKVEDRFGIFTWPWGVAWILGLIWARSFSWSTARA